MKSHLTFNVICVIFCFGLYDQSFSESISKGNRWFGKIQKTVTFFHKEIGYKSANGVGCSIGCYFLDERFAFINNLHYSSITRPLTFIFGEKEMTISQFDWLFTLRHLWKPKKDYPFRLFIDAQINFIFSHPHSLQIDTGIGGIRTIDPSDDKMLYPAIGSGFQVTLLKKWDLLLALHQNYLKIDPQQFERSNAKTIRRPFWRISGSIGIRF